MEGLHEVEAVDSLADVPALINISGHGDEPIMNPSCVPPALLMQPNRPVWAKPS
jgi:hypothetical protein